MLICSSRPPLIRQGSGEGARGYGIHGVGQLRFRLGLVHGGVRPRIEYPVRSALRDKGLAGGGIGKIQGLQPITAVSTGGDHVEG